MRSPSAMGMRQAPRFYDPSGNKKTQYANLVRTAMLSYGLNVPYFAPNEPITMEVNFVVPRRKQDVVKQGGSTVLKQSAQAFPTTKDVDNLLKFVMDALQGIVYRNDMTITKVIVTKMFAQNADVRGWTEVQFGTSSEPPTLATRI